MANAEVEAEAEAKTPHGPQLLPEMYAIIFDMLPQVDLRNCRLLNKFHGSLATKSAFRHIRLVAREDTGPFAKHFVDIARCDHLRRCVREVTVDTWVRPQGLPDEAHRFPWQFLAALPFLRYFTNLGVLNLRFSHFCNTYDLGIIQVAGSEWFGDSPDLRYYILYTIFQCLAGVWSRVESDLLADSLHIESTRYARDDDYEYSEEAELYDNGYGGSIVPDQEPLRLRTLTISNLGDFDDPRLTKSDTFRRVVNSGFLKELKVLFNISGYRKCEDVAICLKPPQYDVMETIPRTWLSPNLAMNLKVLSLYHSTYWGWCPRIDLRAVNPGTRLDSGFPNLRVLALGNYIFTHDWQVEWIASLGHQNGCGGLEELYLDDCPILYQAAISLPLESGEQKVSNPRTGETVTLSYARYPRRSAMSYMDQDNHAASDVHYPLRWHKVLPRWQESMQGLKVFKMGSGAWRDISPAVRANNLHWPRERLKKVHPADADSHCSHLANCHFLWYDRPPPPETEEELNSDDFSRYKDGVGLSQKRLWLLQYIYFDVVGDAWIENDTWGPRENDRLDATGDLQEADDLALDEFMAVVRQRQADPCSYM